MLICAEAQVGEKLVAGFTANVQPPQTSRLYRLGIVLVTVLMVLLPVVYVRSWRP